MANEIVFEEFLDSFVSMHHDFGLSIEEDDCSLMDCFTHLEGSPLVKIQSLKDRGNGLFKQNRISDAATWYSKASQILCFVVEVMEGFDNKSFAELGVSLNLNLTACALKQADNRRAENLCSLVLSHFPTNVKALFRRGLAFTNLKMLLDAKKDFEKALLSEPKNKAILRELSIVEADLLMNPNGKRNFSAPSMSEMVRQGKRPIIIHENDCDVMAKDSDTLMESCSTSTILHKRHDFCEASGREPLPNAIGNVTAQNLKPELINKSSGHHVYELSKKGSKNSRLRIPEQNYQKLLHGQEVSFYQKSQCSIIKIRILKPNNVETKESSETSPNKKRNRRKRHKKGKSRMETTRSDTPSSYPSIISHTPFLDPTHSLSPMQEEIATPLFEVCNNDGHHQSMFIFSSCRKTRRYVKSRRLRTRNQDHLE